MTNTSAVDAIELLDGEVRAFLPEDNRRARVTNEGSGSGRLSGISVGVKDLYRVDGLPTRAGSALPAELFAASESAVVRQLRRAGSIILGKTAMDEFAYCEPPATVNPRDPRRTPGGSSGGSAAAVAAGMCPLTVGSQTLQSTIVPAAYCGILGYKPTFDRIPFDGVALAPSFDTVGLLASTLDILGRAAECLIPHWQSDTRAPRQPVLGVPPRWGLRQLHTEGWEAFDTQTRALRDAGFRLKEACLPWNDDLNYWARMIGDLCHGEMARVHQPWYETYKHLYRPRTRTAVERGRTITEERLTECRNARDTLISKLTQATQDAEIDCWICPATGSIAPLGYERTGDSWLTSCWSYAGWPQLTIPVFDGDRGLPHGLQCITPAGHDEHLLQWATPLNLEAPNVRRAL
jgi:Asp-tRNA(Asn)/Glu-tRNA(Gln) amidotransferase A subunit family amidase